MLANENPDLSQKLQAFRKAQADKVLAMKLPKSNPMSDGMILPPATLGMLGGGQLGRLSAPPMSWVIKFGCSTRIATVRPHKLPSGILRRL